MRHTRRKLNGLLLILTMSALISCQSYKQKNSDSIKAPEVENPTPLQHTYCKDPRPQMCTQDYKPVCATRDTGVRCVTTPCPSTEQLTKPNACSACADLKVISYADGECS